MLILAAFWLFLLSACIIMFLFGQKAERFFVVAVIAATAMTFVANFSQGLLEALPTVAAIDLALAGAACIAIVKTNRYWPMWFAGFHFNTVATELGAAVFPGLIPEVYGTFAGAWSLPALGLAAYGVMLDYRARVRNL